MLTSESATVAQLRIREAVRAGNDLRVIAHAGTGKTSTLLWALPEDVPTLFLEYNRDLRLEARAAAERQGMRAVDVHNYDSFLVQYYDVSAPSKSFELAMSLVLRHSCPPRSPFSYEIIVIDEAQDLTEAFVRFVQKIIDDNKGGRDEGGAAVQVIMAGDPKQTVYSFRGASSKFLTDASAWPWRGTKPEAAARPSFPLSQTFRFGEGMCGFVNDFCSACFSSSEWESDISSAQQGGRVVAWTMGVSPPASALVDAFLTAVAQGMSVCVLAASVREENLLLTSFTEQASAAGQPLLISDENDDTRQPVLRTVHTVKGKQYDVVFFFVCQEDMWLTKVNKHLKKEKATLLYVGCTRARQVLHLVEDASERVVSQLRVGAGASLRGEGCVEARTGALSSVSITRTRDPGLVLVPAPLLCVTTKIDKLTDTNDKEALLDCLAFGTHRIANAQQQEPRDNVPLTSTEELAVRLRAQWHFGLRESGGAFASSCPLEPLVRWALEGKKVPPVVAYARLARRIASHRFLPVFGEQLMALTPELASWKDWGVLSSFLPERRYGHASVQEEAALRPERCASLYLVFLEYMQGSNCILPPSPWPFSVVCSDHMVFRRPSGRLVLPVFASCEATRPVDVLAAALAADHGGRDDRAVSVVYLQRSLEVVIEVPLEAARMLAGFKTRFRQGGAAAST
jgi:hypothetical protein